VNDVVWARSREPNQTTTSSSTDAEYASSAKWALDILGVPLPADYTRNQETPLGGLSDGLVEP
jgi:hypothetical protein